MSTHLLEPPRPQRANHTLPCLHCATETDVAHDAVRVVCPICTAARLSHPGPLLPPRPVHQQLDLCTGEVAA